MHIMSAAMQSVSKPRRRFHSDAFKRQLVELSLAPGASVAAIALEHGINANLLFGWRRARARSGSSVYGDDVAANATEVTLLPVQVVAESVPAMAAAPSARHGTASGSIEIEVAGARVRLRGTVDESSLRSVLAALRAAGT